MFAVLATIVATRADDQLRELVEKDQQSAIIAEHRAALGYQFEGLLQPGIGGIPDQYHITVYAVTPDERFLIPVFPPVIGLQDPSKFSQLAWVLLERFGPPTRGFW